MAFPEVTLSYPYILYRVEIFHVTTRQSTAIEWVLLEAISKCGTLSGYSQISVGKLFKEIFMIPEANLLLRPCLLSLQDMGAITMQDIDDETDLDTVPMDRLQLTDTGRELQKNGLLPEASASEMLTIAYDITERTVKEDRQQNYTQEADGISVSEAENADQIMFPEAAVRTWLTKLQQGKQPKSMAWLTPTTKINIIQMHEATLLWRNAVKRIEIDKDMHWRVAGMNDEGLDRLTLLGTKIFCPKELQNILTDLTVSDPRDMLQKFIPPAEANKTIKESLQKDSFFCVDEKYYNGVCHGQLNNKGRQIGIIFNASSFRVETGANRLLIRIPDNELQQLGIYISNQTALQAGFITVTAADTSQRLPIAFCSRGADLAAIINGIVEKYYTQDSNVIFALFGTGATDKLLQYAKKIIAKEDTAARQELLKKLKEASLTYCGKNLVFLLEQSNTTKKKGGHK